MKNIINRVNLILIKSLLPWVAAVVTALPYSDKRSRFLDRLLYLLES